MLIESPRSGRFSVANPLSFKTRRTLMPYAYIAPAMALFAVLMVAPITIVFYYSALDRAILNPNPEFVGFRNFQTIFSDPVFWQSVLQTLYFTIMSVVFHLVIGLWFALMLNSPRVFPPLRNLLRVIFILPWLFNAVIIAILWRLMLDPNGIINNVLLAMSIVQSKIEWFSSPDTAIHALTFVNIWAGFPLYMVSLLAGLQGVPKDLYEAAEMDGANGLQKLRYITLPQLKPIIISIALLDFIWTMQVFPLVWMTTGGGPIHATEMLSTYTYKLAFTRYQFSLAAASAVVIFVLSMSMTYLYIKHQKASR